MGHIVNRRNLSVFAFLLTFLLSSCSPTLVHYEYSYPNQAFHIKPNPIYVYLLLQTQDKGVQTLLKKSVTAIINGVEGLHSSQTKTQPPYIYILLNLKLHEVDRFGQAYQYKSVLFIDVQFRDGTTINSKSIEAIGSFELTRTAASQRAIEEITKKLLVCMQQVCGVIPERFGASRLRMSIIKWKPFYPTATYDRLKIELVGLIKTLSAKRKGILKTLFIPNNNRQAVDILFIYDKRFLMPVEAERLASEQLSSIFTQKDPTDAVKQLLESAFYPVLKIQGKKFEK